MGTCKRRALQRRAKEEHKKEILTDSAITQMWTQWSKAKFFQVDPQLYLYSEKTTQKKPHYIRGGFDGINFKPAGSE